MNPPIPQQGIVFSVSKLNALIKDTLEGTFPQLMLEGEISNYRPNSSGHLYFTLKDEASQIGAVMFRSSAMSLQFAPKDGMKVQCTGRLTVYPPRGNYQIVVSRMTVSGEGAILKLLEDRKRRLAAEGLFDSERKRPLPAFPRVVGVVTSPTGAALRDILQITRRRNRCVSVVVLPALVQGDDAAPTIVRQIRNANDFRLCDVLIVGRGGGSLEDLLPFSDESVVRAIAGSGIPVVSAVGHEIDWALSDYAADRRAPTPSAAAEIAVPLAADISNAVRECSRTLYETIAAKAERIRLMVRSFDSEHMELQFRAIEHPLLSRFDSAKESLLSGLEQKISDSRHRIQNCVTVLENASPKAILARGFSMVRDKETQEIVRDAARIAAGRELEIFPAAGKITARVEQAHPSQA